MSAYGRILVYHTVDEFPAPRPAGIDTAPRDFERQMEALRKRWRVVPLAEIVEAVLAGRRVAPDALAITFDDGYRDNYLHAFPVLKALDLPATIFLVARYLDGDWPAADWEGTPRPMLRAVDMREMSASGITFGSHGSAHRNLVACPRDVLREELIGSADRIETLCGVRPRWFSYPFGAFDEPLAEEVRAAGYEAAFAVWTTAPGLFAIPRIPLHRRDTGLRFAAKVRWYLSAKRLLGRLGR